MGGRVRRAGEGDEAVLRALRLRAMRDAPDAFGSTYERELARTPADWRKWFAPGATFLLETDDGPQGLVAGMRDATDPQVMHLMAMWVDPAQRGAGGADDLVAALIAWAVAEGARTMRLEVMRSNGRASRFYERMGFRVDGPEVTPEREGPAKIRMARRLA